MGTRSSPHTRGWTVFNCEVRRDGIALGRVCRRRRNNLMNPLQAVDGKTLCDCRFNVSEFLEDMQECHHWVRLAQAVLGHVHALQVEREELFAVQ